MNELLALIATTPATSGETALWFLLLFMIAFVVIVFTPSR